MSADTSSTGAATSPTSGAPDGKLRATEKRPLGGVDAPLIQGASPTVKESTMDIVAPVCVCPTCGAPSSETATNEHDTLPIATATYLCSANAGHIWSVRWLQVAS